MTPPPPPASSGSDERGATASAQANGESKTPVASTPTDARAHWGSRASGELNPPAVRYTRLVVLALAVIGLVALASFLTPRKENGADQAGQVVDPTANTIVATPKEAIVSDVRPGEEQDAGTDGLRLPPRQPDEHALDPALTRAREALQRLEPIQDYTATVLKRERIDGTLSPRSQMAVKIRREQRAGDAITAPFSVYLRFETPQNRKGQEAIYVRGRNEGKLVGHEGPNGSFVTRQFRAWLDPEGRRAMTGEKYPIDQLGLDRMLEKLLERGATAQAFDDLRVSEIEEDVAGRPALLWKIEHTDPKPEHEFHTALIWIDKDHKLPVKYQGFVLPPGETKPVLDEEYEYRDLKFDVGLTDRDFDPDNPAYNYPALVAPAGLVN